VARYLLVATLVLIVLFAIALAVRLRRSDEVDRTLTDLELPEGVLHDTFTLPPPHLHISALGLLKV
jgi:hypothetical protein